MLAELIALNPESVLAPLDAAVVADDRVVEELRVSLRTPAGQVEPIVVAPAGEGYRLVLGASRLEACRLEGRSVQAVVKDVPDEVSAHRRLRAEAAVGAGQRMSAGLRKAAVLQEVIEQIKKQRKQDAGRKHGRGQGPSIGSVAVTEPIEDEPVSAETIGSVTATEPIAIPEPLTVAVQAGVLAETEVQQALAMAVAPGTTTRNIVDKIVGVHWQQRENFQRLQEIHAIPELTEEQRAFVAARIAEVEHAPSTAADALRRVESTVFVKVAPEETPEERTARTVLGRVVALSHAEVMLREDIGFDTLVEALRIGGYPEELSGIVAALYGAARLLEQAGAEAFGVGSVRAA